MSAIKHLRPAQLQVLIPIILMVFSSWSQETITNEKLLEVVAEKMVSQIETSVDPKYVYSYEQTKFVPPSEKTLLIMGQTVERITEYANNFSNQPLPGGWAAYWGIPEFSGVTYPKKNETGSTQHHQMIIDSFPNTVIQSGLWMVGKWDVAKKAGKGDYDDVVKKYATWAKTANRPIYLRIGYEFDGAHNELEPKEYIKAYKRIVNRLRKEKANNIAFVWHSYASKPYKDYTLSDYYPGDDYVDWVGISVFGHAYGGKDFGPYCDAVLDFAKAHKKPVMIAESNPINGIEKDNTKSWDDWFVSFFGFIYNKNIKAVSFINEDWQSLYIEGISNWKDGRLYNNQQISKAWFAEINKEKYLKQSSDLFNKLGYKKK